MNHEFRYLLCALFAFAGCASTQIDCGGGKAAVGNLTNRGSIGWIMAATPASLCPPIFRNGLIEILYAIAPLDPDADADVNGLPDVCEEARTSRQGADARASSKLRKQGVASPHKKPPLRLIRTEKARLRAAVEKLLQTTFPSGEESINRQTAPPNSNNA